MYTTASSDRAIFLMNLRISVFRISTKI